MANSLFNGLLPPEMKAEIFNHVDQKQRQKIRRVCQSWEELISEFYGVTVIFSDEKWTDDLPKCTGLIFAIFRNYNSTDSVPILKRPDGIDFVNRMSTLTICGELELTDLTPIFEECKNLRSLECDNPKISSSLNHVIRSDDPSKLLPALRNLKIKSDKAKGTTRSHGFWTNLKNLQYFFASEKSKLTSLHLNYTFWPSNRLYSNQIFDEDWTLSTTESHSNFQLAVHSLIKSNRETLSELRLDDTFYKRTTMFKFHPVPKSGFGLRESNSSVYEFTEKQDFVRPQGNVFGNFDWLVFMRTQNYLENLTLFGRLTREWTKIVEIFTSNAATLKNVTLTNFQFQGNTPDQAAAVGPTWSFNGMDFTRLQCLEKLSLLSNNTGFHPNQYRGRWSEFLNFQSLPTNLRILKLSLTMNFLHESNFCPNTFIGLKNLETFEFTAFPWFTFGGVSTYYLDAKTIRSFAVWLTGLKKLILRNRIIPDLKIPMTPLTIPNLAIDWIRWVRGIDLTKSNVGKNDEDETRFFLGQRTKDVIYTINIEPAFRQHTFVL